MKIDPKLKNRLRFNQLESDARDRLRRFYHLTSAEAALQIVQSGFIWSDAPDLCPHFTPNKTSRPAISVAPEIWLRFQFSGTAHLVPEEADVSSYAPNGLYLHLYEWPDMFGLQGMRVAQVRVSAPTSAGLECIGFQATEAYLARCKTDLAAAMVLTQLKRMTASSRSVQVPKDVAQKEALVAQFPPPRFGRWEMLRLRLQLWQRRMRRRSA